MTDTLAYLSGLFSLDRYEKERTAKNSIDVSSDDQKAFNALYAQIEKYRQFNQYEKVNLGEIFQFMAKWN